MSKLETAVAIKEPAPGMAALSLGRVRPQDSGRFAAEQSRNGQSGREGANRFLEWQRRYVHSWTVCFEIRPHSPASHLHPDPKVLEEQSLSLNRIWRCGCY
jgi:hypothetical protein